MRIILIIFTALFILSFPVSAQQKGSGSGSKEKNKTQKHGMKEEQEEDENPWPLRRFEYGINIGVYFPNKYSANFYNGTPYPPNVNNVDYVINNETWNREIKQLLGISETDIFYVDGYPLNMHYNVVFSGGLFLRVNFNRKNSILLQANYARMTASDVVTLKVPNAYLSYADLRLEQVIGREGRVMIDLGYQRSFPLKSWINLFLQAGATMCYTQVIKSTFVVEGREYNMVNIYGPGGYQQGYNNQTFTVNQNAFGFGGFLGVGAGIPLNAAFSIEPGFFTHYYPTNLEGYPDFKASFGLYLRILIHSGSTDE